MRQMLRKTALAATAFAALVAFAPAAAVAEGAEVHIEDVAFPFEGPFGTYDSHSVQRGLQIYTEVCAACHGLKFVPIRSLTDEGGPALPEDQVRAYASQLLIADELANPKLYNAEKDLYEATYNSNFPANTTANAPDLSLMAKARAGFHGPYGLGINQLFKGIGGPEYIVAILEGYHEAPACAPEGFPGYYNVAFAPGGYPDECKDEHGNHTVPGSWIAMPPPLSDGQIEFADEHANDVHSMSMDTAQFLMWAAEPKLDARKDVGFVSVIFLIILSVLLYLTNKSLWAPIKGRAKAKSAD